MVRSGSQQISGYFSATFKDCFLSTNTVVVTRSAPVAPRRPPAPAHRLRLGIVMGLRQGHRDAEPLAAARAIEASSTVQSEVVEHPMINLKWPRKQSTE